MINTLSNKHTYTNRCERCNRQLKNPLAKYGWRCAEILGIAKNINMSGDHAYMLYLTAIKDVNEFIKENISNLDDINLVGVYEAAAKMYLTFGLNEEQFDLAYIDFFEALSPMRNKAGEIIHMPAKAKSIDELLETRDLSDFFSGNFFTTTFTEDRPDPAVYLLQTLLNANGIRDKFGRTLKEDGIYSAATQWAANSIGLPDLEDLEYTDITRLIFRFAIGNDACNDITKYGFIVPIFEVFGFKRTRDLNGTPVYHATVDAWQQIGGYNSLYDAIFYIATNVASDRFEFKSGGKDYAFWVWKGDYLNLGAGAELGIYTKHSGLFGEIDINSPIDEHWLVDTSLAMHMTVTLTHKGKEIIKWDPFAGCRIQGRQGLVGHRL